MNKEFVDSILSYADSIDHEIITQVGGNIIFGKPIIKSEKSEKTLENDSVFTLEEVVVQKGNVHYNHKFLIISYDAVETIATYKEKHQE